MRYCDKLRRCFPGFKQISLSQRFGKKRADQLVRGERLPSAQEHLDIVEMDPAMSDAESLLTDYARSEVARLIAKEAERKAAEQNEVDEVFREAGLAAAEPARVACPTSPINGVDPALAMRVLGTPAEPFARAMQAAMRARGINTVRIGNEIGINRRTVYRWMTGEALPISEHYAKLCDLLGPLPDPAGKDMLKPGPDTGTLPPKPSPKQIELEARIAAMQMDVQRASVLIAQKNAEIAQKDAEIARLREELAQAMKDLEAATEPPATPTGMTWERGHLRSLPGGETGNEHQDVPSSSLPMSSVLSIVEHCHAIMPPARPPVLSILEEISRVHGSASDVLKLAHSCWRTP